MKAKLIILENPVIVTDEEIKKGDNVIFLQSKIRYKVEYISQCNDFNNDLDCKKEISFNKPIDYNGIDFGIVDVEKLAKKRLGKKIDCEFHDGWIEGFSIGFDASQQLNEKKFSEDEVREAIAAAKILDKPTNEIIASLSTPKTFEVEIEETPTNIKILKKL